MLKRLIDELSVQTAGEKHAVLQGTNLFFGALLGVNLATTDALPITDYAMLVILLAGTVGTLTIFSRSQRRRYAWSLLSLYVALVAIAFLVPNTLLADYSWHNLERLLVTLALWTGLIILTELWRVRPN